MNRLLAAALFLVALPVAAQDLAASPDAVETALAYVRTQAPALGLASADVSDLAVIDGHTSARSGVTYLYVHQQHDGLDVVGAQVTVAVGHDGRVIHTAGDLISGLSAKAQAGNRAVALSAEAALRAAAARTTIFLGAVAAERASGNADGATVLTAAGLSSPSHARQVYVQTDGGTLRRAWEVTLDDARSVHWWVVAIDAVTGAELSRYDLTVSESFGEAGPASLAPIAAPAAPSLLLDPEAFSQSIVAGYKVYPLPLASPIYASTVPPADGRSVVSGIESATASPWGWHDTDGAAGAEFTTTRGNNTHTYIDRNDDELPDVAFPAPDGGTALSFIFPINFAQTPNLYTLASATNLFYISNAFHDIAYQYGFTEAAGNFQQNTYGRGGLGNDAVDSEVQSGADICNEANPCHNNANFGTPADGQRPRMQMYDGINVTPAVDGSLDAHVVVHEYGHGVSNRLVGGPSNVGCLQNNEQMGEGWSDWYGNMVTMRTGDTRTTRRPVGNYLFGQPTTGVGIRPAPYTTDFAVNNYTYQRTRSGLTVPHGIGFAWATILWEVTWDMIDTNGGTIGDVYNANGTAGNQIMLNLVTEGLKLAPCNPGFVSGRDAILAADAALYPDPSNLGYGVHYATLYAAFARRGLGISASQGSTSSNADNTEAFDVPLPASQVSVASAPISRLAAPGGTAAATVQIGNAGPTGNVVYTSSLANVTFVPAARPASPAESGPRVTGGIAVSADKGGGPGFTSALAPAAATAPVLRTGQNGGYSFDDSTEPGGPVYAFTSIAGTGMAVSLSDDDASGAITLPFAFPFYGTNQTSIYIGSNGILSFGAGTSVFTNVAIPAAAAPNNFIAPFWDDLVPSSGGTIHYQTVGSTFVVQYSGVPRFPAGTGSASFQAILKPTGEITVTYQAIPTTNNSATIGIENATGSLGLQASFDEAYAVPNFAVRFRPARTWLTTSNGAGTVAPGATAQIGLAFNGTGLTEGTYTANLVVQTNAAPGGTTTIPVAFTIGGTGVVSGGPGWRLLAAPATGVTVDNLAAVNLVQGVPGYYPGVGANLLTGYNGTTWSSAGTGTTLAPGRGFFWYFYNQNLTPGGASNSSVLPTTLATTNPAVTTDTPVALHASGDRANMLGNPFGVSLNLAGIASWPGAAARGVTVAQMWDPGTSSYDLSSLLPTIAPWQGFWVEPTSAGTLTIPASARTTGGVLQRDAPAPTLAFTLAQADGPLQDRAVMLTFPEGATVDRDAFDASKLTPMAGTYVSAMLGSDGQRAVESLPTPTDAAASVPLHVTSVGAGADLVLSWPLLEALPETWAATLTDTQTGTTVNLRTAAEYAFSVQPEAARDPLAAPPARQAGIAATQSRFVVTVGPRGATAGESGVASVFALEAAAPNPARGQTTLTFSLATAGAARLSVVDLLGREVAVLVEGEQGAGRHAAALDVSPLAPGVYVVRLSAGAQTATRRVVVVR